LAIFFKCANAGANTFNKWLAAEIHYSPHLEALGLPGEADDGVIIGFALFIETCAYIKNNRGGTA